MENRSHGLFDVPSIVNRTWQGPVYVRLSSLINGAWQWDYTYTASNGTAVMTTPTPGSMLPGSTVTFQWTSGTGSSYGLWIGSNGAGSYGLYGAGTSATSATVSNLPMMGGQSMCA